MIYLLAFAILLQNSFLAHSESSYFQFDSKLDLGKEIPWLLKLNEETHDIKIRGTSRSATETSTPPGASSDDHSSPPESSLTTSEKSKIDRVTEKTSDPKKFTPVSTDGTPRSKITSTASSDYSTKTSTEKGVDLKTDPEPTKDLPDVVSTTEGRKPIEVKTRTTPKTLTTEGQADPDTTDDTHRGSPTERTTPTKSESTTKLTPKGTTSESSSKGSKELPSTSLPFRTSTANEDGTTESAGSERTQVSKHSTQPALTAKSVPAKPAVATTEEPCVSVSTVESSKTSGTTRPSLKPSNTERNTPAVTDSATTERESTTQATGEIDHPTRHVTRSRGTTSEPSSPTKTNGSTQPPSRRFHSTDKPSSSSVIRTTTDSQESSPEPTKTSEYTTTDSGFPEIPAFLDPFSQKKGWDIYFD